MSKLSVQQLPKDKDYLRCFTAAPGHKLIYSDYSALEPHVLTQFSRDPGLLSLYGPNAIPNDVYLFYAAQTERYRDAITRHFDPFNPTPEGIAAAKKHCKDERTEFKPIYLGKSYGLGAGTMSETTGIPREECEVILKDIEDAQPGVRAFGEKLLLEWKDTGGWVKIDWVPTSTPGKYTPKFIDGRPGYVYNGRGRPLGVAPDKCKDLVNRFVQSTGHDVLLQYLVLLNKRRVPGMQPYNVDMHDATIWQVPNASAHLAVQAFESAYQELNSLLGWEVKIKGDVQVGFTLADFLE